MTQYVWILLHQVEIVFTKLWEMLVSFLLFVRTTGQYEAATQNFQNEIFATDKSELYIERWDKQ